MIAEKDRLFSSHEPITVPPGKPDPVSPSPGRMRSSSLPPVSPQKRETLQLCKLTCNAACSLSDGVTATATTK